jgi:hypothetical protein
VELNEGPVEQNGEHFQHLFNKINITIVIFLLIPRILNSPFSLLQLSLNVTFAAIVKIRHALTVPAPITNSMDRMI